MLEIIFLDDEDVVVCVRESCIVALDAADYCGRGNGGSSDCSVDDNEEVIKEDGARVQDGELSFAQQKALS